MREEIAVEQACGLVTPGGSEFRMKSCFYSGAFTSLLVYGFEFLLDLYCLLRVLPSFMPVGCGTCRRTSTNHIQLIFSTKDNMQGVRQVVMIKKKV